MRKLLALFVFLLLGAPARGEEPAARPSEEAVERQAVDPIASLLSYTLLEKYRPGSWNGDAPDRAFTAFSLTTPHTAWESPFVFRVIVPFSEAPSSGLADVQLGDARLFLFDGGRWALGVAVNARAPRDGSTLQAGPVLGIVWQNAAWTYGLLSQNFFGTQRSSFSMLQLVLARGLGNGWSLGLGEGNLTYGWSERRLLDAPLGLQLAKASYLAGQPVRFFVSPFRDLKAGRWGVSGGISLFAPGGYSRIP